MVKSRKVIELPQQDENVPGFFILEVGDSRLILDAQGNEKQPAEVRAWKRRKKTTQRRKSQGRVSLDSMAPIR